MNTYKTTTGDILKSSFEIDTDTIALNIRSPFPADKSICYIELDRKTAENLALYILEELGVFFDKIEELREKEPSLFEKMTEITKEHYGL